MGRVSYFQRFSQPENHTTNNTLLMLRLIYQNSPIRAQEILKSIFETDLEIGFSFRQQSRELRSVPDALIEQKPMRIFLETKLGASVDRDQITRHFQSIKAKPGAAGSGAFLLALTSKPISNKEKLGIIDEGNQHNVNFAATTFSQLVDVLRAHCKVHETHLQAVIEDYESYLVEAGLLDDHKHWLVVFPCGTSISENQRFGIYYEPSHRRSKATYRYIGLYNQRMVQFVGVIQAVAIVSYPNGKISSTIEAGVLTSDEERRIQDIVENTNYYDLKQGELRFYVVDHFFKTEIRKVSPGGIMNLRYLKLSELSSSYDPTENYSSEVIAKLLSGSVWPEHSAVSEVIDV